MLLLAVLEKTMTAEIQGARTSSTGQVKNTWDEGVKIKSFDLDIEDNFGVSVAIDGDYAIVGASGESSGGGHGCWSRLHLPQDR